jgi:hypothetical protein
MHLTVRAEFYAVNHCPDFLAIGVQVDATDGREAQAAA